MSYRLKQRSQRSGLVVRCAGVWGGAALAPHCKGGRPTKYNDEIANRLLAALADGLTQKQACIACGVSESALRTWREQYPDLEEINVADGLQKLSPDELAAAEDRVAKAKESVSPSGNSGKQSGLRTENVAGDAGEGNPAARTSSKSEWPKSVSSEFLKPTFSLPVIKPWSSLPDRADSPYLSDPAVWGDRRNHRLCLLVTRAILAVLKERGK